VARPHEKPLNRDLRNRAAKQNGKSKQERDVGGPIKGKKTGKGQLKRSDSDPDDTEGTPSKKIKLESETELFAESLEDDIESLTEPEKVEKKMPPPLRDPHADYVGVRELRKKPDHAASSKDRDPDDPLADMDFTASLLAGFQKQHGNTKKMNVIVSKPFFRRVDGRIVKVVVVFLINRPMLWYLKVMFIIINLDHIQKKRALLQNHDDWEMKWKNTFEEFNSRVSYLREDKLNRNSKGKTISHISFVVEMEEDADIQSTVLSKMETLAILFKRRPGCAAKNRGTMFIEFLKLYDHQALLASLLSSMSDGQDEAQAANSIAVEFDKFLGGDGLAFEWDATLDKMWTNYDIKRFLNNHVRVNSWDGMSVDAKKACYRYYDPQSAPQFLPDWDTIVKLTWND
jgi:hypothetical protein